MPKSSSLPYAAPFRYTRPAQDLQATFGAQTGNPPILPAKKEAASKSSRATKKQPSAVKKVSKPGKAAVATKVSKPAKKAAAKPKAVAKKASGKR